MSQGMTPYYEADGICLFLGDCREVMASLPAESVSCIMTSPPFWGLRSYPCEPSIWGGDSNCPHRLDVQAINGESYAGRQRWQHDGVSRQETPEAWVKETTKRSAGGEREYGSHDGGTGRGPSPSLPEHATCSLCSAWKGQLGLEPSVGAYIEHTMEWLREAKRVLRKDGVAWIDLGDSRGGSGKGQMGDGSQGRAGPKQQTIKGSVTGGLPVAHDVPPKSLALIPSASASPVRTMAGSCVRRSSSHRGCRRARRTGRRTVIARCSCLFAAPDIGTTRRR